MSHMFNFCISLKSLPDISKWNTSNIEDMSYMFSNCNSLESLSDISKWNTSNVQDMSNMFYNCKSLKSLPDISKWNASKVKDMSYMFYNCESLISLPDLTKWNISNIILMTSIFSGCKSLKNLLDNEKFMKSKVNNSENKENFFSKKNDDFIYKIKEEINLYLNSNNFKQNINSEDKIRIFGKKFVKNNKDKCIIIYKNKKYELKEYLRDIISDYNDEELIQFNLNGIDNIIDMSYMFEKCNLFISISDIIQNVSLSNFNTNQTLFKSK